MDLNLRAKQDCLFDEISLGEVMLRLDPGDGRIKTARTFRAWEGGGEYNVARGLRRCFGLHTAVVTALAITALLQYGAASFQFAVSAILAMVVMHDAMGVRWQAGQHALNQRLVQRIALSSAS